MSNSVNLAAKEYIQRQNREVHPEGTFDKAGRWYPNTDEECSCCANIRTPSRAYPLSYNKHCRSLQHVANLYDVEVKALRKAVRENR